MFKIPENTNPVLIDAAIASINSQLLTRLVWLNNAFPKVYDVDTNKGNGVEPCLYIGNNEYISMLPSAEFGNFSFFIVDDPNNVAPQINVFAITYKVAIVFWFDISTIYNDTDVNKSENVKLEILNAITKNIILPDGRITVVSVVEKFKNAYKGYQLSSLKTPYDMFPHMCIRVNCEILLRKLC